MRPMHAALLALVSFAALAAGQASGTGAHGAPYAGQHARDLKALSREDVADLRAGRGWGFAKPAELNGYPGPLHVLELRDALELGTDQATAIERIYESMRSRAVALGEAYLEAERELEAAFAARSIDAETLAALTARAAQLRGQLRNVHLAAHLETLPVLAPAQTARYQALRGYAGSGDEAAEPHRHAH